MVALTRIALPYTLNSMVTVRRTHEVWDASYEVSERTCPLQLLGVAKPSSESGGGCSCLRPRGLRV